MRHCSPRSRPTLLLQPQPHHQSYRARSCRSSACCHGRDVWWKKPSICERAAQRAGAAATQRGRGDVHSTERFPTRMDGRQRGKLSLVRRSGERVQSCFLAGLQDGKMQACSWLQKRRLRIRLLLLPHAHLFPLKLTFDFLSRCKTSIIFTPALGSLQTKTFKAVKSWEKVKWHGGSISWCFFPAQQGTPANLLYFVRRLGSDWIFPLAL